MYGLNNKAISYLLEQFDSVQYCNLYKSKYVPKRTSEDNVIKYYLVKREKFKTKFFFFSSLGKSMLTDVYALVNHLIKIQNDVQIIFIG
jgi:hypothetical protein